MMRISATIKGSYGGLQKALSVARYTSNINYQYTETNEGAELRIEGYEAIIRRLMAHIEKSYGLPLKWETVGTAL